MDLEQLRNLYHIVAAQGIDVDAYEGETRLLDNDLAAGVKALYDDEAETIVAYLFAKGSFTEETAREWVRQVEQTGVNLSVRGRPTFILTAAVEDLSFEDVYRILGDALERDGVTMPDGSYRWAWLVDVYADFCIVSLGARYYRLPYTMDQSNRVQFGELVEVQKRWEDVPPPEPESEGAALAASALQGTPQVFTFTLRDPVRLPAEVAAADDGLIWKEIFHVSKTVRPVSGEVLIVGQDIIDGLEASFAARVFPHVPITASTHYEETNGIVPAFDSAGFVDQVVKVDGRLFGGLNVIDEDIRTRVEDGRIRDCSVYVWFDVYDRKEPDKIWPCALVHLLLTNYPQIPDLEAFGVGPDAVAATALPSGVAYQHYVEDTMANQTQANEPPALALSAEDEALLAEARALRDQGYTLQALAERQAKLAQKARGLEIQSIVSALEGATPRDDVTQIDGCRHYPAVIKAVEAALQGLPKGLAADINEEGQSPIDKLVLGIVNALPAEARLQIAAAPARPDRADSPREPASRDVHRTTPLPADVMAQVSDEQIEALIERIGL